MLLLSGTRCKLIFRNDWRPFNDESQDEYQAYSRYHIRKDSLPSIWILWSYDAELPISPLCTDLCAFDNIKLFIFASSSRMRGHRFKMKMSHVNCNIRKNFFSNRVVNDWNTLPSNIVNLNSLRSFRAAVRNGLMIRLP